MAGENVTQSAAHDELDFGKNVKRVDFAITAAYQVGSLVRLLQSAGDANNLKECMAILGPKIGDLLDVQVSALSDSLFEDFDDLKSALGFQGASHV